MTNTEPDNYERVRAMPRQFLAEYRGETRRCTKAEHVNIGRGWMLLVEGVHGVVSEDDISNPRPLE